jgi:hypothetical protein
MTARHALTPEVHVVPVRRTATWQVHDGDPHTPSSEHANETDAELAARRRAVARGAERVVVHDRYDRTRRIAISADDARPGCRHRSEPANLAIPR